MSATRTVKCKYTSVANGEVRVDKRYTSAERRHQDYDVICQDANGVWQSFEFRDPTITLYDYMIARGFDYDSAIIEEA